MLVLKSPEAVSPLPIENHFEQTTKAFIHGWTPHTSLTLAAFSIGFFILVMLFAAARRGARKLTSKDLIRAGFAAGPIPVYFILPLVPYDSDLSTVILDQPLTLFFAGVIGIRWTLADILDLADPRGKR